jgi:phospholipase C
MDLSRIQYVMIVYMENRSFDHLLGYLNLPGNHPKWDQINGMFEAMKPKGTGSVLDGENRALISC